MRTSFLTPLLVVIALEFSPCGSGGLFAQDIATLDTVELSHASGDSATPNKYNIPQYAKETWRFIIQPTTWDGSDWLKFGATFGSSFLVMQIDQPVRDAVTSDQRYYRTVPLEIGRLWAETYPPVLFFTGFALHSWISGDVRTRKTAFEIAQVMFYAGGVRMLLGPIMGRARPYSNEGPKSFHPFSKHVPSQDYQSAPGGHCVIGFALSTVLSRNAGPRWLKGLAYVPAVLTFVSRVYQDRHWLSDDVLGSAIGYFVATWVVDQHEKGESRIRVSSIYPLTISIRLN